MEIWPAKLLIDSDEIWRSVQAQLEADGFDVQSISQEEDEDGDFLGYAAVIQPTPKTKPFEAPVNVAPAEAPVTDEGGPWRVERAVQIDGQGMAWAKWDSSIPTLDEAKRLCSRRQDVDGVEYRVVRDVRSAPKPRSVEMPEVCRTHVLTRPDGDVFVRDKAGKLTPVWAVNLDFGVTKSVQDTAKARNLDERAVEAAVAYAGWLLTQRQTA